MRTEVRQILDEAAAKLSPAQRAIVLELLRGAESSALSRSELEAKDASGETGRRYGAVVAGVLRLGLEGLAAEESGDASAWESLREPGFERSDAMERAAAAERAGDTLTATRIREAVLESEQEEVASREAAADVERTAAEVAARRAARVQQRAAALQGLKEAEAALARARELEAATARPATEE